MADHADEAPCSVRRDAVDTVPIMAVGVVGLGYVGLPLVVAFAEAGEEVIAVDIDPRKVEAITAGDSYIEDIPSERAARRAAEGAREHRTMRRSRAPRP